MQSGFAGGTWSSEGRSVLLVWGVLALLFAAVELWRRRAQPHPEWPRKLIHLGAAFVSGTFPWLFASPWSVLAVGLGAGIMLGLARKYGWIPGLFGVQRRSHGELWFLLAVFGLFCISRDRPVPYLCALIALGLGDAAAALGGFRFSKKSRRSWQGSLWMFGATAAAALLLLVAAGLDPGRALGLALVVAACATAVESVSPGSSDNLTVPLVAWALLALPKREGAAVFWGAALAAAAVHRPRAPFHAAWVLAALLTTRASRRRARDSEPRSAPAPQEGAP
ncbi:MAG: hypothetical protein FJX77_00725 [Armatimonadetes bacterium]|nr:hypothetical protein [Armatimonadota bacterium]